jgi:STE24 endopeptidase
MANLYSYYGQVVFLVFILLNHVAEIYLSYRQLSFLQDNRNTVPDEFSHTISLADHQKAVDYSTAKLRFGQVRLVWDLVILLYWFPFRGAEKLFVTLPEMGMHKEVLFLVAFGAIQGALGLPWTLYSTFVLEERFGFNRTTLKMFILDRLKGAVLGAALIIPLLYLVLTIFNSLGSFWWIVSFIAVTAFQLGLVLLYPNYIAPLFNKFHPLEGAELKAGIERLVERAGLHAKEIFVMDASKRSSHGNAYFTGFGKRKRVVFFDTLLKDLGTNQILAILAHELGHMKLKHIPKSLATSLVLSFIGFGLMGYLGAQTWFYSAHFVRVQSPAVLFLLFTQAIPMYTFFFTPVSSYISRKREFEADAYAASETKSTDLISGLLKLYQQNSSPVITDKVYSNFYHSHPPALERIRKLESLEGKSGEALA